MNNTPIYTSRNIVLPLLTPAEFDAITDALMKKFGGNEGGDIGDASNLVELIANTCTLDDTHDSYSPAQMIAAIYALLPPITLMTAQSFCSTVFAINTLDADAYNKLHAAYDTALTLI